MTARPCRGCGRELTFAPGPSGKTLPLERVRNVYIISVTGEAILVPTDAIGRDRYISHFETCPQAGRFSRKAEQPAEP